MWAPKLSSPSRPRHFGARCRSFPAARSGNRPLSACLVTAQRQASVAAHPGDCHSLTEKHFEVVIESGNGAGRSA